MKIFYLLLIFLGFVTCNKTDNYKDESNQIVVYREKCNENLVDIAYDLLNFEKYEEALDLVQDDTSWTSLTVKIIANDGLGNIREAIDYAIIDLRRKDASRFYEGSWELWDLYLIFIKDIDYGLDRLNEEYSRCHSNYQVRQLMMKLYWYQEDYEKVISLGDEFMEEFPELPDEVTFNVWRQDALDSLIINGV